MSEETIDNYFLKLNEIKDASLNPNTTLTDLQDLIIELTTLNNLLDVEFESIDMMDLDFPHLRKILLLEIERARKDTLHVSFYELLKQRNLYIDIFSQSHAIEETILYSQETTNIKNYIKNIVLSCNCMSSREFLIKTL